MASTDYSLLVFLEWLETGAGLICPLKSEVQTLRLKMSFFPIFLSYSGKWHIKDGNLKVLLTRILTVYQNADFELRRLWVDLHLLWYGNWSMPMKMDDLVSGILERLQLLTIDIRQVYTIISKSPRSILGINGEAVLESLNSLLKNIGDLLIFNVELVSPMKEELEAVGECLGLFRDFFWFTAKLCGKLGKMNDLLIHAEIVADSISCLLYLCSVDEKMNDETVKEMKMQLSSELHKISPITLKDMKIQTEVGKNYVQALKMLKSELYILDLHHLDSLLDYVLKLSETKLSSITSDKCLYEEVRFLTNFFFEAEDESWVHDRMRNYFLERVKAVTIDTLCAVIYSLHNDEQNRDEARGLRMAIYDLQHICMLQRENATKADYIYFRRPWRFLGPNAWGEIGSQLEFLKQLEDEDELFGQIELVQKELLPLTDAFSKYTAIQPSLDEELEIERRRLICIMDRTNHVITSFKYSVITLWSCKLELYYVIQNIKMIKIEVQDIINRFTGDAEIFEDKQLRNGSKILHILSIVGMLEFEDQLRCLGTNMDLISPLKDEVRIFRLKASFLRVFLSCRGKWHIEDGRLKVILTRIQTVSRKANLRKLWEDFVQIESMEFWGMPMNMEHMLSSMQERLQFLNSDIQEVYTILSKSSRFITGVTDRAVMESLNSLLENIEDLLRFNTELAFYVKYELEAVEKHLRFLGDFLCFTAKRCSELGKLKDLLIHAEIFVDNISCLLYLCSVSDKLNDQMVKEMKLRLSSELQKFSPAQPDVREIFIKVLRASKSAERNSTLVDEFDWGFLDSLRDYILELSDTKTWSTTPIRDQILLLREDLPFLVTYFAMDLSLEEHIENDHQIFKDLLESTCAAIHETRCVIGSLYNDKQNEIYKKFSDFLARKFYDFYFPKSFGSNFPRTIGHGFIDSLLGTLKELLNTKADLVAPLKLQIVVVQQELLSVREDISKTAKQCEELQSQWTHFTYTAYHIEYVIDSFVAGRGTLSCHKLGLFNVLEEIKTIKLELQAIKNNTRDDKSVHKSSCFPSLFSTKANPPKVNAVLSSKPRLVEEKYTSKLVIFPEVEEEIIEQLKYGSKKLNFLSIVGMPGIGKTTLANSVFQHSSVTGHFHVRARCCISQVYDKRRLLREILQQVTAESNQCSDNDDFEKKLYQSLKGRRYLIFMDDIWSIRPWENIRNSFPNDENGSRIMFTSRFDYISSQSGPEIINYGLSPISEERSWKMLESKIFGDRGCPTYLVNLGQRIAANCKGLPLTIDLIAGILRGKETGIWKKVAESMMEYLFDDPQGRCQKVVELSYQNLPDELKPCFLYFAAFPEDTDIPTRELILLWIAEGFVQLQKDDLCLEDAAEKILNNLIGGSLVIVSKRRRLGGVKATRIHDLLHNFASAKAKEESFMLKIDCEANFSTLASDGYQWRKLYRLSIYPINWDQFLKLNPFGNCARSLICSRSPFRSSNSLQFSFFKLLRVLYIPQFTFRHHPSIIFTLIHLRFLAIGGSESKILSEIHKLWNLETFIIENLFPFGCLFLDEFCNMMRLGHFCSHDYVYIFYVGYHKGNILEKSFLLDNLRTLYHVQMSYADAEKILKLMPNLVKLKVKFYNPDGGCYPFPKLAFLKKLESLEVTHDCTEYPCKIINFPPYLKNLVLSNFCVPWTDILEIGKFENLEILKLKYRAFEGAIWNMNDGQFPKLKYLSLEHLNIEEWNAMEDNLSCLEQLHVDSCGELKELPSCLADVATLQRINLYYCRSSAKESAERIKEEQKEAGNDQLVVNMKDSWR